MGTDSKDPEAGRGSFSPYRSFISIAMADDLNLESGSFLSESETQSNGSKNGQRENWQGRLPAGDMQS